MDKKFYMLSFNLCFAEKENPSENREGHRWDERCGHQLDSSGDAQCHEYVHFYFNYRLNAGLTCEATQISDLYILLADKASPKASPRKRTNRAAGADQ